ncbi:MAG: DUF47 family protein [Candidatus Aminicenantes bacterium]|nr:DUF47 family protein [Candidatus Aminicenantes bacterium]
MFFSSLLPKDNYIFDMFDKMCINLVEGAQILVRMLEKGSDFDEPAVQLKTIESETDKYVHQVMSYLHKTFVTPIDREDIFHLVNRLDDILDLTEGAASRIRLYQPKEVPEGGMDLVRVLLDSTKLIKEMIGLLRNMKKSDRIIQLTVDIKHLESEADLIRRSILARLFEDEKNVFELIKWKDILDYIEKGTDRCDDVGNITEGIVLENT